MFRYFGYFVYFVYFVEINSQKKEKVRKKISVNQKESLKSLLFYVLDENKFQTLGIRYLCFDIMSRYFEKLIICRNKFLEKRKV